MMEWQPIETAPKDARVVYIAVGGHVFPASYGDAAVEEYVSVGRFFKRRERRVVGHETGWRVCVQTREGRYALHGQIAPIAHPDGWMELPLTPQQMKALAV